MPLLPRRRRNLRTSPLHTMKSPSRTALIQRPVRWAATRPLRFLPIVPTTYPMKQNDEWSVKASIDKIDSETKQRIKGDAEFKIFAWDTVRQCYIPNGGYNQYKVERQSRRHLQGYKPQRLCQRFGRSITTPSATRASSSLWRAALPAATTAIGGCEPNPAQQVPFWASGRMPLKSPKHWTVRRFGWERRL